MEEIRKYPPTAEHVIKYGPLLLAIIAVVVIAVFAVCAIPANAAQPDYATLYQEALARIAELEQNDIADAEQLAAKENENAELTAELAAKDEEIASLIPQLEERDAAIEDLKKRLTAAEQENQRLNEKYGTTYYVEYKVCRNGSIVGIGKTFVPKEEFDRLDIGDTLPTDWEYFNYPESTLFIEWTATVIDLKPLPAWDENV